MKEAKACTIVVSSDDCTGCAVCAAVCPMEAIFMYTDEEGFYRPQVNITMCNDCGLCRFTCPVNPKSISGNLEAENNKQINPPTVLAMWHLDDEIRRESSSGAVFTALADNILAKGGVVAGAAFDDTFVVRHVCIENSADLPRLRGSKYVQSKVYPATYHLVRGFLQQGRTVLFSGTPCHVAALKRFIGQPHNNLFCCDIVCHGVPSPLLFAKYVKDHLASGEQLEELTFRDKSSGWKNYGVRCHLHNGAEKLIPKYTDPYMLAFLHNYALRPSCYVCKFKTTIRLGDLTLADFWGVAKKYPEYDLDDKGTSLVLVNTQKGNTLLDACNQSLFIGPADLDTAIAGNSALVCPNHRPPERDTFYRDLSELSFETFIRKYRLCPPSIQRRVFIALKFLVKHPVRLLLTSINKS